MADSDIKQDDIVVDNPEPPELPEIESLEPQNIGEPVFNETDSPTEIEGKIVISSKSSEKLLTEPHAVKEDSPQVNVETEEPPEEETKEEYKEEIINEDGTTTIVKKVPSSSSVKLDPVDSYIEKEEEYEEEETDEAGEKQIVKKKRIVRIQREPLVDEVLSYDEIEQEYEEEETDENGQTISVKKKRIIKVPKVEESVDAKDSEEPKADEEDKTSKKEEDKEEGDEVREDEEDEDEFEEEEEEVEEEEQENLLDAAQEAQELGESKRIKVNKKKKLKKGVDEKEEEELKSLEVEEGRKSVIASKSSMELRQEEDRAAISVQFEILTKLRSEYNTTRKRLLFLNNKLIQYLKKQKMEHVFTETKEDPELEQKYIKKLTDFYEINQEHMNERLKINTEWEGQRSLNEELAVKVKQELDDLMALKREIASKLIDPRTGRTLSHDKTIEDLLVRQENLLKQMSECRLTQIKLKRKIEEKKEERKMDHMGADFNLMDYEKLSSLKEFYIDKINERDIEIAEVTQKLNNTEDKLRSVKEQLREKEAEVTTQQRRLQQISSELHKKRADLNQVKATRHKTEKNTAKMKQQSGLLSYPNLLKDFDEKNEQVMELTEQIENLKSSFRYYKQRIQHLQDMSKKRSLAKFS